MGPLPASWALSKSCLCNLRARGSLGGGRLWSETADVLSAAAECFLPLPQPLKARRVSCVSERGSPRLPRMETSMKGWVWSCRPLPSPERPSGAWDTELPPHPTPSQKASTLSGGDAEKELDRLSFLPQPPPILNVESPVGTSLLLWDGVRRGFPHPWLGHLQCPAEPCHPSRGMIPLLTPLLQGEALCPCKVA